jgi:hypothetical protein
MRDEAMEAFRVIKLAVLDVFQALGISTGEGETDWKDMGIKFVKVIANVVIGVAWLAVGIVTMVATGIKVILSLFDIIVDWLFNPFVTVKNMVDDVVLGFHEMFSGNVIGGIKRIGQAFLDFLLSPLRLIITTMIKLADALSIDIPDAVRAFATKTFTGRQATLTDTGKPAAGGPRVKKRGAGFLTGEAAKAGSAAIRQKIIARQAEAEASVAFAKKAFGGLMEKFSGEGSPAVKAAKETAEAAKKSPCIDNNISVAVDGGEVARGQARHEAELKDRIGFKTQAWAMRTAAEFGAAFVRGGGG